MPIITKVMSEPFSLLTCLWAFALVARFYRISEILFVESAQLTVRRLGMARQTS
jgi:hypothetical protein